MYSATNLFTKLAIPHNRKNPATGTWMRTPRSKVVIQGALQDAYVFWGTPTITASL